MDNLLQRSYKTRTLNKNNFIAIKLIYSNNLVNITCL